MIQPTADIVAIVTGGLFKTGNPGVAVAADSEFGETIIEDSEDFMDFGEQTTYWPLGASSGRRILAIIDRDPPKELLNSVHGFTPKATVTVRNDETHGITSDELNKGGDELQYPVMLGEAATRRRIVGMIKQDAGMITLGVR